MSSTSASQGVEELPLPSRNPLPLSAAQEQQVRDLYYARVRGFCADEIKDRDVRLTRFVIDAAFASCAAHRTISATWACRTERLTMNACMMKHATRDEQDKARAEWFATRTERGKQRDEAEERRKEAEKKHREWWGLDESTRQHKEEGS
ncbi:MAG: hypothetical protein M1833_003631 [Piccolia ochrophora]|nr:MAG: hypothetical protein M1833_003631 [Piccolia ochrophora]